MVGVQNIQKKHDASRLLFFVALSIIALDQLTKYLIKVNLAFNETIDIIQGIFSVTYRTNTGIGFGLLQGLNIPLMVVSSIIILLMGYFYYKLDKKETLMRFPLGLIISGALSNLVDRIIQGSVTDFIYVHGWPAFNVADSAISIGAVMLIIMHIRKTEGKAKNKSEPH